MEENHDDSGAQGIPWGLLVADRGQGCVLIKLDRRAIDPVLRDDRPKLLDEGALIFALPDIMPGVNLQQILSGHADEAVAQRRRQVLRTQRTARILIFDGFESPTQIVEQDSLKFWQFPADLRITAQQRPSEINARLS